MLLCWAVCRPAGSPKPASANFYAHTHQHTYTYRDRHRLINPNLYPFSDRHTASRHTIAHTHPDFHTDADTQPQPFRHSDKYTAAQRHTIWYAYPHEYLDTQPDLYTDLFACAGYGYTYTNQHSDAIRNTNPNCYPDGHLAPG